jgi:DNA repair exonuclease SbcCD ATPase subunit
MWGDANSNDSRTERARDWLWGKGFRIGEPQRARSISWTREIERLPSVDETPRRGQKRNDQNPDECKVCGQSHPGAHGTSQVTRTPDGTVNREDQEKLDRQAERDIDQQWKKYTKRQRELEKDIKRIQRSVDSCVQRMTQSSMHEEREAARRGLAIERANLKKKQAELENLDWATYRA